MGGGGLVTTDKQLLHLNSTPMDVSNEEDLQQLEVQCRGACAAIQQLVLHFGDQVFLRIPKLEELSFRALQSPGVDRIPDIFLVSHWQICVTR